MLRLSEITKDYKVADSSVRALKGVSLDFRKNEFVCILGQSGCGKTTLLNIIGGLDHYTSGDLVIQGKSTKHFNDRDWDIYRNHRIGFIFQSYNLIPHQTVLGNVEIALTIAGIGREERKQRAMQALERVGLGEHVNKRPNQLSGGQMQRVAIARALVNNPDILLADEPTGALDSQTSVQIMELIREIAGERLVIMVTHNPVLAEQYASRIVRLKDGLVDADSNPYDGSEETEAAFQAEEEAAASKEEPPQNGKKKKEKKQRASMSFLTSLALSARNLLTKKGRTIVTSIAGSIGIISVCLVLALSGGFNNYINAMQAEMLSAYPIEIRETAYDITSLLEEGTNREMDITKLNDRVYVDSFLTGIASGMNVTNNISDDYISYVRALYEKDSEGYKQEYAEYLYDVTEGYGNKMPLNFYTEYVSTVENPVTGEKREIATPMSVGALIDTYKSMLAEQPEYASLSQMMKMMTPSVLRKLPNNTEYVLSQYDVIKGKMPEKYDETVLILNGDRQISDLSLALLGYLSRDEFLELANSEGGADSEPMSLTFDRILAKPFTVYPNDNLFTKNPALEYSYNYAAHKTKMDEEGGIPLKVVGILQIKEGLTYGCLNSGLGYTNELNEMLLERNRNSAVCRELKDADVVTATYSWQISANRPPVSEQITFRELGGAETPNSFRLYVKNFEGKENVIAYLDAWNAAEGRAEEDKVTYTDNLSVMMGMIGTMMDLITYVLVAFTAISLVVSSVMIGIITYVSVVERVKEIGVLRSLGARKRDIRNLFNAETFIIGLAAGIFGVVVTYLLSFAINAILFSLTGIAGLAALPVTSALVMVLISVLLTLVSGLIPASAAAKKDPVIALRTE